MNNDKNGIIRINTGIHDNIINLFIKELLLIRGSRNLFSSETTAKKYLSELSSGHEYYFPDIKTKCMLSFSEYGKMKICIFTPIKHDVTKKAIIYLHGGAFVREPNLLHYKYADRIASDNSATLYFCVYPKAPVYSHYDTDCSLKQLYGEILQRYEASDIIIMGDSCGATIAVCFTNYLKENGCDLPGMLCLFSPLLDISCRKAKENPENINDPMLGVDGLEIFIDSWIGNTPKNSYIVNPAAIQDKNLPATYIFMGSNEIILPDTEQFFHEAEKCGADIHMYVYKNMYHCFVLYPLNTAKDVMRIIHEKTALHKRTCNRISYGESCDNII